MKRLLALPTTILIIVSLLGLALTAWWGYQYRVQEYHQLIDFLRHPEKHIGESSHIYYATVTESRDSLLICWQPNSNYWRVINKTGREFRVGEKVTVRGHISADTLFIADEIQNHPHRSAKYLVSLLSLPIIGFLLFRSVTFSFREMRFKIKDES